MTQDELKQKTAEAALAYVKDVPVIGVGTGSTVKHFINYLADVKGSFEGAVSSSEVTTEHLRKVGIPVLDLNAVGTLEVYVDGADEVNPLKQMIKGGGGALTREKIIAGASDKFICIVDATKKVSALGAYPLPIEVIPMARSYVARELVKMGGKPVWREDYFTDNGNEILDIHNLEINEPVAMEKTLNNITGVVTVGLFAVRPADVVLIGNEDGIITE